MPLMNWLDKHNTRWLAMLLCIMSLAFFYLAIERLSPGWIALGVAAVSGGILLLYLENLRLRRIHRRMNEQSLALMGNMQGGVEIATLTETGNLLTLCYVSEGWEQMTGYTFAQVGELLGGDCLQAVYARDREYVRDALVKQLNTGGCYSLEYRLQRPNGELVWVLDRGKIFSREGDLRYLQSVLTDITELKEQQEQLRLNAERFRLTFESTDNAIFEYDFSSRRYLDFTNCERLLGRTLEQINSDLAGLPSLKPGEVVIQDMIRYFYHADDTARVEDEIRRGWELGACAYLARVLTADGGYVWCKLHLTIMADDDGQPYRALGFIGNVDSVKRQSEVFRSKSEKDALTGFYNKAATVRRISEELAQNYLRPHVLYVLDLDNFKNINDTWGHIVGDTALTGTAQRIRSIFRSDDILGRVGGDEFVVLVSGITESTHIAKKAQEMMAAVCTLQLPDGQPMPISVSVGIDVPGRVPTGYEEAFGRADKALYQAKRNGKNCLAFSAESFPET